MGTGTITVNYLPDGDDWSITVTTGDKTLTSKAPGLIAARDRAEQLIDKIAPQEEGRTVVHLLDGDAFAFTTAYLHARHGIPAPATALPEAATEATPPGNVDGGGQPATEHTIPTTSDEAP